MEGSRVGEGGFITLEISFQLEKVYLERSVLEPILKVRAQREHVVVRGVDVELKLHFISQAIVERTLDARCCVLDASISFDFL